MHRTAWELARDLVRRRRQPRRWIIAASAVAFLGLAYAGGNPRGFLTFGPAIALAAVQIFLPTALGWLLLSGLCAATALMYVALLCHDIFLVLTNRVPDVLVNTADSFALVLVAFAFVTVAIGIAFARPTGWPRAES